MGSEVKVDFTRWYSLSFILLFLSLSLPLSRAGGAVYVRAEFCGSSFFLKFSSQDAKMTLRQLREYGGMITQLGHLPLFVMTFVVGYEMLRYLWITSFE